MLDSVLSWACLAAIGWIAVIALVKMVNNNESTKLVEYDYITSVYNL